MKTTVFSYVNFTMKYHDCKAICKEAGTPLQKVKEPSYLHSTEGITDFIIVLAIIGLPTTRKAQKLYQTLTEQHTD